MVSHPIKGGGDFLPPHGRTQRTNTPTHHIRDGRHHASKTEWAVDAMNKFKKTGCLATREELVVHYMCEHVKQIAYRLACELPPCIDPEDLMQSAFFGLSDCIDKYDPERKVKFESYSRLRIEGAMKDFLRREDPASRLARSRSKLIAQGISNFRTQHGRSPTNEELQKLLQLNQHEFLAVMRDVHVPCTISFQPAEGGDDEGDIAASIHVERKSQGFARVDRNDLHAWLYQQLGHYDVLIVTLTYVEELTMKEIGNAIGYSESRVSQRLKQIHALLKTRITDHPEAALLMAS